MLEAQKTFSPLSQRSVRCCPVQIFAVWALSQQCAAVMIVFWVHKLRIFNHFFQKSLFLRIFLWKTTFRQSHYLKVTYSRTFLITKNNTTTWPAGSSALNHKMNNPWPWIWDCFNATNNSITAVLSGELWRAIWCTTLKSVWNSFFCCWSSRHRCRLSRCSHLLSCGIGRIELAAMPIWKIVRIIEIVGVTTFAPMALIVLFSDIASKQQLKWYPFRLNFCSAYSKVGSDIKFRVLNESIRSLR